MVWWHHWLNGHEFEETQGDSDREVWHAAVHGVEKSWTWLSDWTIYNKDTMREQRGTILVISATEVLKIRNVGC